MMPREVPATGDHAFDEVFQMYLDPVFRYMYRQVGNRQDAEDLTSEVFLTAARHLDTRRPSRAAGRWLFTVSRNIVADHWRKHYRLPPLAHMEPVQLAEFAPAPNETPSASERSSQVVDSVLGQLPERYRRVLELRFLHGYTIGETAEEMGISPENVKVIQHRALAKAAQTSDELL